MKKKKSDAGSSFIAFLILLGIASWIWKYVGPIISFLIGAAIVIGIIYIIVKLFKRKDTIPSSNTTNVYLPPEQPRIQNESIKKQLETLTESIELVNESKNIYTVLSRYTMVCDILDKLSIYTDTEIRSVGVYLKEPLISTSYFMQNDKIKIINQAIERYVESELSDLTTVNGKIQRLDSLYNTLKKHDALNQENVAHLENLCFFTKLFLNVSPEIADLLWIGDGKYQNYSPPKPETTTIVNTSVTVILSNPIDNRVEPSTLYLSLPVSEPAENSLIESPPYYPTYKALSPEQRWLYWKFLADPFSPKHDVGYAFLFFYGLERHMALGDFEKAFDITLKLRKSQLNDSFQGYTATALTLMCASKKRDDLALKLLELYNENQISNIPLDHLLFLKYKFKNPLTVEEIIDNYQYFGFQNNRYIKSQPELFYETLTELLQQDFNANTIDLNRYFPNDIKAATTNQERIFANLSLCDYTTPIHRFQSSNLAKSVLVLLEKTHETVKAKLRYGTNINLKPTKGDIEQFVNGPFTNIDGRNFEIYCADLLAANGFSAIETTKTSGDQGVDILADKDGIKYGIQCKLYSKPVGNSAVQQINAGIAFYNCQKGVVLTNNYFTESARELADVLGIALWDRNHLYEMQKNIL